MTVAFYSVCILLEKKVRAVHFKEKILGNEETRLYALRVIWIFALILQSKL